MKAIFLWSLLSLFALVAQAQKTIEHPVYVATNVGKLDVEKVFLSDTATVIYFRSSFSSSFRISPESYITENGSAEKLMLKSGSGIQLGEFVKLPDNNVFSLCFPAVKTTTTSIHFIESDCENCFKIIDISLNTNKKRLVENPVYGGNWYKTDGSKQWVLGVYDTIAIYQNNVWKYTLSSTVPGTAVLKLMRPGVTKTLYAGLAANNEACLLGEQPDNMLPLSKQNKLPLSSSFDQDFSKPVFRMDSAVYKGFLKAYSPKLGFKTGQLFVNNDITGEQESYLINISADGRFFSKFPMYYPQTVFVRFPGITISVYCEPGKETFQYYDFAKQKQAQEFMGDCGPLNEELKNTQKIMNKDYSKMLTEINGFSKTQYSQYIQEVAQRQMAALRSYQEKHGLSKKAWQIISREIMFGEASDLFEYNWQMEAAYKQVNKVNPKDRKVNIKPVELDSTYLNAIGKLALNDELNLLSQNYNTLINRMKFADVVRNTNDSYTMSSTFESLRKSGVKFSAQDELVIRKVATLSKMATKDSVETKKMAEQIGNLIGPIYAKYNTAINKMVSANYYEGVYQEMYKVFKLKPGLFMDLMYAEDQAGDLKRAFIPFTEAELSRIKAKITIPAVYNAIAVDNREVTNKVAESKKHKANFSTAPRTEGENIFDAITQKYKGKVVYVDFWATWCGPCRSGIEEIAPLKEDLKNEDVVFVYITSPSSPLETYKNMIPNIKGEHYRVSEDDWNFLCQKFKISGIPHYVLVDKKGEIADANLELMDNGGIRKRILALSKSSAD